MGRASHSQNSSGLPISRGLAYCLVQKCMNPQDLGLSLRVLTLIIHSGLDSVPVLGDHLIRFFASCGTLTEANQVYIRIARSSQYTWNAIIDAHAKVGNDDTTLELYDRMQIYGGKPDKYTFLSILKVCCIASMLMQGRGIHESMFDSRFHHEIVVGNTLVSMYAKCGSMEEAHRVFDGLLNRDIVSWNVLISGYVQNGQGCLALEYFAAMQNHGIHPNGVTFSSVLKACASICAIHHGRYIHQKVAMTGPIVDDIVLQNTVIDMYSKCGSLSEAYKIFRVLPNPDLGSWGAMIAGYAQHGNISLAFGCYENMQYADIKPSKLTFLPILKACGNAGMMEHGRLIHENILRGGYLCDIVVGNTLLDMYAKCGSLEEAFIIFVRLSNRDIVSWNVIMAGCAQHDKGYVALELFEVMQSYGIKPTRVTFLSILKACGTMNAIEQGRYIHEQLLHDQFMFNVVIGSSLVDMYAKCGYLDEACIVFNSLPNKNVVAWGALITGYVQHAKYRVALDYLQSMHCEGVQPDEMIFLSTLKACGGIGAAKQGRYAHEQLVCCGLHHHGLVGSALIDMYANCGSLEEALQVFDELQSQDVILWGAMITGFAQLGEAAFAIHCFEDMQSSGIKANPTTFVGIFLALSHVGLVDEGFWYFRIMNEDGIDMDIFHAVSMVDLLGRAGRFTEAEKLLMATREPNICLWVALLNGCRLHGNIALARKCFDAIVLLHPLIGGAAILMSNIYADVGMEPCKFSNYAG